jgi:hypothetical protein
MAAWSGKTSSILASALACPAGGTFYSPATTAELTSLGGTLSSTLSVPTQSQVDIWGSTQNNSTALTVAPIVALLSSPDGGATWYMKDRAGGGLTAGGNATLGVLTAAGNFPFAFSFVPDGNATLALYVYNNATTSTTLFAAGVFASVFS